MIDFNLAFGIILTIIMGFGFGSFATMAVYRLPRNMPWIGDKPRCLMCKHELGLIDYFSVFSYFLWKGKCRYCKGSYECNLSYFFTEFFITFLLVINFLQNNYNDYFVLYAGLIVASVILAIIDVEHKKIPAKVLLSLLVIGVAYRVFEDSSFYNAIYGAIFGGVIGVAIRYVYFILIGKKHIGLDFTKWQHEDRFIGPGFDYVKLLAIIGIWMQLTEFIVFVIAAGATIIVWRLAHNKSFRIGAIMAAWQLLIFLAHEKIFSFIAML